MTTSCPSCGAALPGAAIRFCLACGARLPARDEATVTPRTADPGPPRPPGRAKTPPGRRGLLIGLVILVTFAGGGSAAYAMLHQKSAASAGTGHRRNAAGNSAAPASPAASSSAFPAASASEQGQLTQFLAFVRASATARTLVKTAVPQVAACTMTPADGITQLQQAITDRQNVITAMDALSVSAIPDGQSMRTDLGNVLQLSINADRDFIGWMQDPQSTLACPASTAPDTDYHTGLQVSAQAVQAKNDFLAIWNPLARQFQLPTYAQIDI